MLSLFLCSVMRVRVAGRQFCDKVSWHMISFWYYYDIDMIAITRELGLYTTLHTIYYPTIPYIPNTSHYFIYYTTHYNLTNTMYIILHYVVYLITHISHSHIHYLPLPTPYYALTTCPMTTYYLLYSIIIYTVISNLYYYLI